ncbi:unnamed protein product [Mytilus edulis]|uniref:Uncharacterized protein n=1 Tax=Mytilus edulis TaxID=6550 RepID=A0A8S3U9C3_MYTED|nr:unnamed protein product [Mytilus edulis]
MFQPVENCEGFSPILFRWRKRVLDSKMSLQPVENVKAFHFIFLLECWHDKCSSSAACRGMAFPFYSIFRYVGSVGMTVNVLQPVENVKAFLFYIFRCGECWYDSKCSAACREYVGSVGMTVNVLQPVENVKAFLFYIFRCGSVGMTVNVLQRVENVKAFLFYIFRCGECWYDSKCSAACRE